MPASRAFATMTVVDPETPPFKPHGEEPYASPIFSEVLCLAEMAALRISPVFYGSGIPRGDGSAVVTIPGLMLADVTLCELHGWLGRIGYRPYYSGMGITAGCPDRLSGQVARTIDRAYAETGRRVHVIGYSLGGVFARSAAVRKPGRIASVITLGTPYRGLAAHQLVLKLGWTVRDWIQVSEPDVHPACATSQCECAFGRSLGRRWPRTVPQTAIYSKCDGMVDWRYCRGGKPQVDVEVVSTHLGLPFNPSVFSAIGARLAAAPSRDPRR